MKHSNEVREQSDVSLQELVSVGYAQTEFFSVLISHKINSLFIGRVGFFYGKYKVGLATPVDKVFAEFAVFMVCVCCMSYLQIHFFAWHAARVYRKPNMT